MQRHQFKELKSLKDKGVTAGEHKPWASQKQNRLELPSEWRSQLPSFYVPSTFMNRPELSR